MTLVVGDMAPMVAFYRHLGVDLPDPDPQWGDHHRSAVGQPTSFDLDSATFAPSWNVGWPEGQSGVIIGFKVGTAEDVDALYAELTGDGHQGQQPPFDAFWGARYAVVSDPEGNAVGIMGPIDPAKRSAPPDQPA